MDILVYPVVNLGLKFKIEIRIVNCLRTGHLVLDHNRMFKQKKHTFLFVKLLLKNELLFIKYNRMYENNELKIILNYDINILKNKKHFVIYDLYS